MSLNWVGAPTLRTTLAFRTWFFSLLAARLAECPAARATTRYIDPVGGNDALTPCPLPLSERPVTSYLAYAAADTIAATILPLAAYAAASSANKDLALMQASGDIERRSFDLVLWVQGTAAKPSLPCIKKSGHRVALKRLDEPSSVLPTVLGEQFSQAFFCDWTEDGNLLVNARKGGEASSDWGLVILDKSGNVMRELATAVRPYRNSGASWRKYGHQ